LQQAPSFRSPHALIEQIEELLSVQGVTPDLLYGRYDRLPNGEAFYRPGLQDCLSVYSAANSPLDINAVEVPVMIAVGVSPPNALAVDQMRRMSPIRMQQWGEVSNLLGPAASRFRIGGDKVYILRSTARLRLPDGRLSDLRRTASLTVQTGLRDVPEGLRVLDRRENPVFVPHFQVWPQ
jgi:general secretion pathway protein K